MKRYLIPGMLILVAGMIYAAGCQPEEKEFDEMAFVTVNDYVEEITAAMLDLLPDLQGWIREPYSDNLPLRYDQERREWLQDHRENIEMIRQRYSGIDFPDAEEIASWQVIVERGEQEWLLEGADLAEALGKLDNLRDQISAVLEMIEEGAGELDSGQSEQVFKLINEVQPVVEAVRLLLFR